MNAADWQHLIDAARDGDDRALGLITREYQDFLRIVADQNLSPAMKQKFSASDVIQKSFIEARSAFRGFHGSTELELRAWLKQIVIRNLTDESRKFTKTQSRDVEREIAGGQSDYWSNMSCEKSKTASSIARTAERDDELMMAVDQLSERQRYVVVQRHKNRRSFLDIADDLSISAGAARNLWTRAMESLREKLDESNML